MKIKTQSVTTWNRGKDWPQLVKWMVQAARLTKEEEAKLEKSLAAEIIGATAFMSECENKERIAVAHLTSFMAAVRCWNIEGHKESESLADRLSALNYFPGGRKDVVRGGMILLELLSLKDHKHDLADDIMDNKYNPLTFDIQFDGEHRRLMEEFDSLPTEVKESFSYLKKRVIDGSFWY